MSNEGLMERFKSVHKEVESMQLTQDIGFRVLSIIENDSAGDILMAGKEDDIIEMLVNAMGHNSDVFGHIMNAVVQTIVMNGTKDDFFKIVNEIDRDYRNSQLQSNPNMN